MARIQISNDPSGRIIVSFPYDPLLVEKVKSIDGRRWHPVEKHRSFPKLDGVVERILKAFREENVQIDPALKTATSKEKSAPSPLVPKGAVPDLIGSAQPNDLRPITPNSPLKLRGGVKKLGKC
jgi:hypothetical protein